MEKKSTLFSAMTGGVVAILFIPIILPHILHGYHIMHIFLHVGGIVLASFISMLAGMAYYRLRTRRMLLSTVAFTNFITAEVILLIDATWPSVYDVAGGMIPLLEMGHMLTFATLALLALGVFRND